MNRIIRNGLLLVAILASVVGVVPPATQPAQAQAGTWYVSNNGSDASACNTPAAPCATIQAAVDRAASGDTVKVAVGIYYGAGEQVVRIDKDISLIGGWVSSFVSQVSLSTIDGGSQRRVSTLAPSDSTEVDIRGFVLQNGKDTAAAGVSTGAGTVRFDSVIIKNNEGVWGGGMGVGTGIVHISNSTISNNFAQADGGGILNYGESELVLVNTVITKNTAGRGGGIRNEGVFTSTNTTISNNIAHVSGGGIDSVGGFNIDHSIITQNSSSQVGGGISVYQSGMRRVLIQNSEVINNESSTDGGGISVSSGEISLVNVTLQSNVSLNRGGGFYNNGSATLSNVTVSDNYANTSGGGLHNSGFLAISNTLIANNNAIQGSDCSGSISSSDYNLVNTILGCNFLVNVHDKIGVNPLLFPGIGSPRYVPLKPDSPAVDGGNPQGCRDAAGNPLLQDQRGSNRAIDGNDDGSIVCDIGAYEFDPANPISVTQTFLPSVTLNYCADFFDDFSFPSGWPIGDDEYLTAQYFNGEYRVQSKQPYLFLFRSPACERDNYVIEADMRWDGAASSDIGLLFGLMPNFSQYYFATIDTNYQVYAIFRRNSNGTFSFIAPWAQTGAIRTGTQTNHLKVTRNGGQITLEINGVVIGSWFDSTITGPTRTGVAMAPYDDTPVADARFDNFRVTTIGAGTLGLPSLTPERAADPGQPLPADFQRRLPELELIADFARP